PSETLIRARADRLENWRLLQELAGVLGKGKSAADTKKAVEKPAATKQTNGKTGEHVNGNGKNGASHLPDGFVVGARIRYKDGLSWVKGVVMSLQPVVISLDDDSTIRTNLDVLANGISEGLVEKQ